MASDYEALAKKADGSQGTYLNHFYGSKVCSLHDIICTVKYVERIILVDNVLVLVLSVNNHW